MKEMYEKKCKYCGNTFLTTHLRGVVCKECKKNRNNRNARTAKERERIAELRANQNRHLLCYCRVIERYNKIHGTRYDYGKFREALSFGRVDQKEFDKLWEEEYAL